MPRAPRESKEKEERQGPAPDPTAALSMALEAFNEGFEKKSLASKIAIISGHLGRIPKNGWNKFNGYAYVLESDLVEAVRWYLAAAEITLVVEAIREHAVHTFDGVTSGSGRQRDILTDSIYVYRVTDGTNGQTFTFEVNAQGSDPRDKGPNKASTSAHKFALLRLFQISSGEDAELDEKGDQDAAQIQQPPQQVSTAPQTRQTGAQRGGQQAGASNAQVNAVAQLTRKLGLDGPALIAVVNRAVGTSVELPADATQHSDFLKGHLKGLAGPDIGKVIVALTEMETAVDDAGDPGYGG